MKFNLYKAIIIVLFAVIISGGIISGLKINRLNKRYVEALDIAKKDSVVVKMDSTLYKKTALQLSHVVTKNKKLKRYLKARKAEIRAKTRLVAELATKIKDISTRDSLIIEELSNREMGVRTFFVDRRSFSIGGYFHKQKPWDITFETIQARVGLTINLVEDENDTWETFVQSDNKDVHISTLDTEIKPYRPKWYTDIHYGLGMKIGNKHFSEIYGLLGYSKYFGTIGYSNHGVTMGVMHIW